MTKPFHFRQFSVQQDKCAMKVGTDGVLLGCFLDQDSPANALDIGTGTGVIALMAAQKFPEAKITAVELDEAAALQAAGNFAASAWAARLQMVHGAFQNFGKAQAAAAFNLIFCNPPYFKAANAAKGNNLQVPAKQRSLARFEDFLPANELVAGVKHLLAPDGAFYVVLPVAEAETLKALCKTAGLFLTRELLVRGREGADVIRSVMRWGWMDEPIQISELTIYDKNEKPTEAYMDFTKDFYLWKKFGSFTDPDTGNPLPLKW